MSLKTWNTEHYPVDAKDLENSGASDLDLVDHVLRKWPGLSKRNLERHGLLREDYEIEGEADESFYVGAGSCALCLRFEDCSHSCPKCPITKATGGACCEHRVGPYSTWRTNGRVGPMLKVLRKARRWCVREERDA